MYSSIFYQFDYKFCVKKYCNFNLKLQYKNGAGGEI